MAKIVERTVAVTCHGITVNEVYWLELGRRRAQCVDTRVEGVPVVPLPTSHKRRSPLEFLCGTFLCDSRLSSHTSSSGH